MVMRYYYGLGVGHAYAHGQTSTQSAPEDSEPTEREVEVNGPGVVERTHEVCEGPGGDSWGAVGSVLEASHQPDEDEYWDNEDSADSCSDPSDE